MKKGFTMIELIFVIVILGVLAAVAIPKLNATRDDAEQAKAMTNLATLMGDLTSYYTAQGSFADNITSMTNVPLVELTGANAGKFDYQIKNETCLTFETAGAALVITPNTGATQKVCQSVLTNKSTQNTIRGTYTCDTDIKGTAGNPSGTLEAQTTGSNDKKLKDALLKACKDETAGNYGKPAAKDIQTTTYHNVVTTALGDSKTTFGTRASELSDYSQVVMSFEGAGVSF